MSKELDLSADVIDSRDIIERLEELRALKEEHDEYLVQLAEWKEGMGEMELNPDDFDEVPEEPSEVPPLDPEEAQELRDLEAIDSEGRDHSCDWEHGETLISRDHWQNYCQEMAEELECVVKDLPNWIEIDWQATSDNMEVDYGSIEIRGKEYLIRSC